MNRQGRFVYIGLTAGLTCGLISAIITGVCAASPIEHPHYLHALSNLRDARAWLTEPVNDKAVGKEMDAVENIDKAMGEIKRASIDDGKDLKDHVAIDATMKHRGRLRKVMDLLNAARKDLNYKEDDQEALGWRKAAIKHVDDAIRADRQAIKEVHNDL